MAYSSYDNSMVSSNHTFFEGNIDQWVPEDGDLLVYKTGNISTRVNGCWIILATAMDENQVKVGGVYTDKELEEIKELPVETDPDVILEKQQAFEKIVQAGDKHQEAIKLLHALGIKLEEFITKKYKL